MVPLWCRSVSANNTGSIPDTGTSGYSSGSGTNIAGASLDKRFHRYYIRNMYYSIGTMPATGIVPAAGTIQSAIYRQQALFNRHYAGNRHHSTGTTGRPPLHVCSSLTSKMAKVTQMGTWCSARGCGSLSSVWCTTTFDPSIVTS